MISLEKYVYFIYKVKKGTRPHFLMQINNNYSSYMY